MDFDSWSRALHSPTFVALLDRARLQRHTHLRGGGSYEDLPPLEVSASEFDCMSALFGNVSGWSEFPRLFGLPLTGGRVASRDVHRVAKEKMA